MIESAKEYPISTIFDIEQKIKYVIPKFQREYAWKKENWENLFNDLSENEEGYYLGSIICVNKGTDALSITPLGVIDGQQRLTTISIFYAAIYNKLLELKSKEEFKDNEKLPNELINLKHRLIQKRYPEELKTEVSMQNSNLADYKILLNEIGIYKYEEKEKKPIYKKRNIYKSYQYFKDKIKDYDLENSIQILIKLNAALIVKIEVKKDSDACLLFESLNNRGVPLSSIDLVKNDVLAKLEKRGIKSIDEAFSEWDSSVALLPDYKTQERFLRQYYNAFKYKDKIGIESISKASRSNLIKIYEKLIDRDVQFMFEELIGKSKIYDIFADPSDGTENKEYYRGLIDLLHVEAAPSYVLLLYLFSEYKNNSILIKSTVDFLIKYFLRRNLTDYPPTRDLDDMFMALIKECESKKATMSSDIIIDFMSNEKKIASLDDFYKKLMGDIYEENSTAARFVLCKLQESKQTNENFRDLWVRDEKDRYVWTIEHIFPEGKNIPASWINMVAGGDQSMAQKIQEEWVHKIGNLTLTGYNANLSNMAFLEKRDRKDKDNKFIGYKNGFDLNSLLANANEWKVTDIKKRTNALVQETARLFVISKNEENMLLDLEKKYHIS